MPKQPILINYPTKNINMNSIDYQISNIDWDNVDFKIINLSEDEIDIILDNCINYINEKQLKYLTRQKLLLQSSDSPNLLKASQRYYITHRDQVKDKVNNWRDENREDYLKQKREYYRQKREQERLVSGKPKSNRGRPRTID